MDGEPRTGREATDVRPAAVGETADPVGGRAAVRPGSRSAARRRGRIPVGVAVGVLLVMVLAAAVLLIAGSRHETPIGPLGWTTSEIEGFTDGEQFRSCDFGEAFYSRAGVEDVTVAEGGREDGQTECSGWIAVGDARVTASVIVEPAGEQKREKISSDLPGLEEWTSSGDPGGDGFEGSLAGRPNCRMTGPGSLASVAVSVNGPCSLAAPLARQLQNFGVQLDEEHFAHGLLAVSGPDYLDVGEPEGELSWARYDERIGAASAPGETLDAGNADFPGSTLRLDSARADTLEVCAETTFVLGEDAAGSTTVRVPTLVAVTPNGETSFLSPVEDGLSLAVGEARGITYCGEGVGTIAGDFELLVIPFTFAADADTSRVDEAATAAPDYWAVPVRT
ncbi:hypothetical protein CFRA_06555 [Corynebacterium frankenforstense DSM 45800]|uniref:Uncharacterized protein n=1 Tax=Corynebacterium frankenforstense DSM 45800 TaxID=1437875 RepID=A0A1L7CT11_9CORY|nr:hypothetical protein [Corynebacterium frankenforstense]APT88967.1 hypothetical protein CFRA_06555 [Corynebacterium frankenforstense DSM 45800]